MLLYKIINKLICLFFLTILIIFEIKYKPNLIQIKKINISGFFSEKKMYLNLLRSQPLNNNLSLIINEKKNILKLISKCLNKSIESASSIFMG
jgi:hypothetical protein